MARVIQKASEDEIHKKKKNVGTTSSNLEYYDYYSSNQSVLELMAI